MSSPDFYDNFLSYQVRSGINDRIYSLYKRLKKSGLHTNSSVWEIGCGIGSLTYLILGKVKRGNIEAIDISPKSVAYAEAYLNRPNVVFTACDVFDYKPRNASFDKILLFDVLEHIPEKNHESLFKKIYNYMTEESQLLINLPNAGYILYDKKHNPAALQETDQPIYIENLVGSLSRASLEIMSLETSNIWMKNDYQFFSVRKKRDFKEALLSNDHSLFRKVFIRFKREWRKIIYRYPA